MEVTKEDRKRMRELLLGATKKNMPQTFKEAQQIAGKYKSPRADLAETFGDVFEQLSMLWVGYFPGMPIPGSPDAENQKSK